MLYTHSFIATLLSLSAANAAIVYKTVHPTVYVNDEGSIIAEPTAAAAPVAVFSKLTSVGDVATTAVFNAVNEQTTPSFAPATSSAPAPPPAPTPAKETSQPPAPAPEAPSSPETSAPVSSGSSDSDSSDPFQQAILDYHNKVRKDHGASPLTWDQELADYASNYLSSVNCAFKHSGGPYGENLALGYNEITKALAAWYDEKSQYNYGSAAFSASTGHFTQMVWKGTTKVGCAKTDCSGSTYLVCEYAPRGNIGGAFGNNVLAN